MTTSRPDRFLPCSTRTGSRPPSQRSRAALAVKKAVAEQAQATLLQARQAYDRSMALIEKDIVSHSASDAAVARLSPCRSGRRRRQCRRQGGRRRSRHRRDQPEEGHHRLADRRHRHDPDGRGGADRCGLPSGADPLHDRREPRVDAARGRRRRGRCRRRQEPARRQASRSRPTATAASRRRSRWCVSRR